jgi:hypothetical protein
MLYNIQKNVRSDYRAEYEFFYFSNPPPESVLLNRTILATGPHQAKDSVKILKSSVWSIAVRAKLPDKTIKHKR